MQNILISVSLWDTTDTVLAQGSRIAEAFDSTVWLLHIMKEPSLGSPRASTPELREEKAKEKSDLDTEMQSRANDLKQRGLEVHTLLREGTDPADVILEEARQASADLIVMGAHGRGALYGALLGDIAQDVVRQAPCPVLLVPMKMHQAQQKAEQEAQKKEKA
ncbi:MAG TPA: universal stress protein [Rhodothermales bacterium]|nr:universal stress protein [Rhodothermales bacterium]